MSALGVNLPVLQQLVDQLNQAPGVLGAKISGAGLGDCVSGLGVARGLETVSVAMSEKGVQCERYDAVVID
jgi:mevalonate kinase